MDCGITLWACGNGTESHKWAARGGFGRRNGLSARTDFEPENGVAVNGNCVGSGG